MPPSIDFQIFKTPTKRVFSSVSETASAKSYHDCVLLNMSDVSVVLSKLKPLLVDLKIPSKLSFSSAFTIYTYSELAGVTSISNLEAPDKSLIEIFWNVYPKFVDL